MVCKNKKCVPARGIKMFKCSICGKDGNNYVNGVDICADCLSEKSMCSICGDITLPEFKHFTVETRYDRYVGDEFTVVIDEDGEELDYDLDDLRSIYGEKNIEIIIKTR